MKKDFHYCAIRVIAEKAGFSPEEAQIIAFASQYVDDAVEYEKIKVKNLPPDIKYERRKGEIFDPTCTAHKGFQYIVAMEKDSQLKIYIPFHFIPAQKYDGSGVFDYVVYPNCHLAWQLVDDSLKLLEDSNKDSRTRHLIKLGIALHSYADTWAHQNFSGRRSSKDNDIEKVRLIKNGKETKLDLLNRITGIIPDIGHSEAFNYPDESHLKWNYIKDFTGEKIKRDNTEIFLQASEAIYTLLVNFNDLPSQWNTLKVNLEKCYKLPHRNYEDNKRKYDTVFPEIKKNHFKYHEDEWRQEALSGGSIEFSNFSKGDYIKQVYTCKDDLKWFYFHWEAFNQRKFIVNSIKKDLL
ncbi:MAG: DUF6765 family protein [bacterium]